MFFWSEQLLQPVGLLASNLLLLQVPDEEDDGILASRYISPREAHKASGAHMGLPHTQPF